MERILYKNKEVLCRACLELLDNCTKHDIFLTPGLANKLTLCTSLSVELTDRLPRYICESCYKKLEEFQQFRVMCVDSVERFHEILEHQRKQFAFEEEEDFDLQEENELQITIAESEILLNRRKRISSKEVMDENTDETARSLRRTKRATTKMNTLKNLGTEAEKAGAQRRCRRRKSKRTIKSAFNSNDEIAFSENEQETIIASTRVVGSIIEEPHVSPFGDHMNDLSDDGEKNVYYNKLTESKEDDSARPQPGLNNQTYCKRKFSNFNSRKTIMKSQTYQCDICPMRFFVEHRLVAHKRSHDGLMPYACSFEACGKGFNRWHCLNEHLKAHQGTNLRYTCSEEGCGKVYKHKPTLSMHMRKFHKKGPELKSHVCEICGKVFKSSAILNDHRYTHKDKSELPYPCTETNCDRRFSSKEKLKVHRMRHAGIKNYVCPYCGMRKTTRNELKIHINYHTLERTWPCRFCQHVCNSAGNLKMHVRTVHERAKDYACRFCERTFAKPDTRKYHEMTHTGEKPNECKECGKRFTQPAALRTHSKIHRRHQKGALTDGEVNVLISNENDAELKNSVSDSSSVSTLLQTGPDKLLGHSIGLNHLPGFSVQNSLRSASTEADTRTVNQQ